MPLFVYPTIPHVRKHGPSGYTDYKSYKPWLRDEFQFECVYCLTRERMCPNGADSFAVEHLKPKSNLGHASLRTEYTNLVYACSTCNSWKGTEDQTPDPCELCFGNLIEIQEDGFAKGKDNSGVGEDLISLALLNRPKLVQYRRDVLRYQRACAKIPDCETCNFLKKLSAFPDDLPDLTSQSRRPPSNAKKEGIIDSYHARRERSSLPETY